MNGFIYQNNSEANIKEQQHNRIRRSAMQMLTVGEAAKIMGSSYIFMVTSVVLTG